MTKKGSPIGWVCWLAILAGVITAHVILKRHPDFFSLEIASQIRKTEDYIDMVFVVLYGLLAMYPLSVITNFLKAEGMDNARNNLGKMKEVAPSAPNIKGLTAGRKLRQAETDFVTLKNLHENGLITDEMFAKRKEDLKAALGNNEIFAKSDKASSPK